MSEPARRVATYQDVLDAPEGFTAEIIAGELHLTPRPGLPHGQTSSAAGGELWNLFGRRRSGGGRPGGWVILYEPELHLGDPVPNTEVLVPDLAGWRRARLPDTPDAAAMELAPDWVCEVVSPGARNRRRDRLLKPDAYHRAGVQYLWLVDPEARFVEVFRHAAEGYTRIQTATGSGPARLVPFDAAELDLAEWWPAGEEDEAG